MTEVTVDDFVAALVVLAEAGIPSDVQELLVRGNPSQDNKPNALYDCLESLLSRAEKAEAEVEKLGKLIRDNGTPRFNAVCGRAEKAEATCEKLAAALEEIRDAHPTGSSWSLMNDGTWREAARDFQRIARVTLSADGAEPR
jgi:hypothetical protein